MYEDTPESAETFANLIEQSKLGNVEAIATILNFDKSLANRSDEGATPLMLAAASGSADSVRLLLEFCDPERIDNAGENALMWAARAGHIDSVKALLAATDSNASNFQGETAATLAIRYGQPACAALIERHRDTMRSRSCAEAFVG
jgi:ankyrin repeat protein